MDLELLDYTILNNSLLAWGTSIGVFLAAWAALGAAHRLIRRRLEKRAEASEVTPVVLAAHVSRRTRVWFLFLIALLIGSRFLVLPAQAETIITHVVVVAVLWQMGFWATAALGKLLDIRRKRELTRDPGAVAAMDLLGFVLRIAVWALVVLLTLDNLGVEVTALVAGLGIGGIAVALAAQNILGDLFASLSIVLDKPFVVGDSLAIDDFNGSVEKVGLKTTRLRSLSGEQVVFSNTDLLSSRIRNYGRMYERRVAFTVGVTYQTPADKLRMIPELIRQAIEVQSKVRFDRCHFSKYGDFALIFETVYFVLSSDYSVHVEAQQNVNLIIYESFAREQIRFAYPTQTLHVAPRRSAASAGNP